MRNPNTARVLATRLRELLHYNPKSGRWAWRTPWKWNLAGQQAGTVKKSRRWITIDEVAYPASHLAVLYVTGKWPKAQRVDHRNRNSLDDRWANLRPATHSQDAGNRKRRSDNTSGFKGVIAHKRPHKRPFEARIAHAHLGYFATAEQAHRAYMLAARKHYGEFARAE